MKDLQIADLIVSAGLILGVVVVGFSASRWKAADAVRNFDRQATARSAVLDRVLAVLAEVTAIRQLMDDLPYHLPNHDQLLSEIDKASHQLAIIAPKFDDPSRARPCIDSVHQRCAEIYETAVEHSDRVIQAAAREILQRDILTSLGRFAHLDSIPPKKRT